MQDQENSHNQFVYTFPEGRELIILVPFRARVIKDNQFANDVLIWK